MNKNRYLDFDIKDQLSKKSLGKSRMVEKFRKTNTETTRRSIDIMPTSVDRENIPLLQLQKINHQGSDKQTQSSRAQLDCSTTQISSFLLSLRKQNRNRVSIDNPKSPEQYATTQSKGEVSKCNSVKTAKKPLGYNESIIQSSSIDMQFDNFRIQQLLKWKQKELADYKRQHKQEKQIMEERIFQLQGVESDLRLLTEKIQGRLNEQLRKENENRIKWNQLVEAKNQDFDSRELQLEEKEKMLNQKQELLDQKIAHYDLKIKDIEEKDRCLKEQIVQQQLIELSLKEKKKIYESKFDTLQENIIQIIQQEQNLKLLEQRLQNQIESLYKLESKFGAQLYQQQIQDEVQDLREQGMQLTEELLNKKMERDIQNHYGKMQQVCNYGTKHNTARRTQSQGVINNLLNQSNSLLVG